MPHTPLRTAIQLLAERRRHGHQGSVLPAACRPSDTDTALAIQAGVVTELGDTLGGWKCGMPSEHKLVVAPILGSSLHQASPCPVWAPQGQLKIEAELAFILATDLPARSQPYSLAEIDAAIGSAHLALELIGTRYTADSGASYLDQLADGLFNQGLLLGPALPLASAYQASTLALQLQIGDATPQAHAGQHPAGNPLAPLYWLVEWLRSRGQGLMAGEAIITGAYAGAWPVPLDTPITVQYGNLGSVAVTFNTAQAA